MMLENLWIYNKIKIYSKDLSKYLQYGGIMDIRMNYDEGINYIKNKCNLGTGTGTFIPEKTYSNLTITYIHLKGLTHLLFVLRSNTLLPH